MAYSVLLGDFLHNFVDGISIGVAFRSCGSSFGWVVAGGAAGHEVTQELADFIVLVTKGRLSIWEAVATNLLSGASCVIGGVIAHSVDLSTECVHCSSTFGLAKFLRLKTGWLLVVHSE